MADKKENKKIAPVQGLFSKFGELDSYEELNKAAAGQLEEGDVEALKELAKENGIEEYDVEDYIDGAMPELVTMGTAAMGRIKVEAETFSKISNNGKKFACNTIKDMLETMLTDEVMQEAIMKKGKRIETVSNLMYEKRCLAGTDRDLQEIIKAYYLQGEKEVKKVIDNINNRYKEQ